MIFKISVLLWVLFWNISFADESVQKQRNFVVGGSLYQNEDKNDHNSEYIRGVLSFLNKMIDENRPLVPRGVFYNGGEKGTKDVNNIKNLVSYDRANIIMGVSSSKILKSFAKDFLVPIFPYSSFSEKEREEHKDIIFHMRPSIEEDLTTIATFLQDKSGKIAVLYEESMKYQFEFLVNVLKKDIKGFSYVKDPLTMNLALLNMKRYNPDQVVVLGESVAVAHFFKRAKFLNLKDKQFLVPFYAMSSKLKREIKDLGMKILIGSILPGMNSEDDLIVEYKKIVKRYFPKNLYGDTGFEGYLTIKKIYEKLDRVDLNDKDKVLAACRELEEENRYKINLIDIN